MFGGAWIMDGEMDAEGVKTAAQSGESSEVQKISSLSACGRGEGRDGKKTTSHSCPCAFPVSEDGGEQGST